MNNKITIAVVIILLLLGGGYFLSQRMAKPQMPVQKSGLTQQTTQNNSTVTSLKELLAQGKTQQCSFTSDANGATVKGTTYISGGKMRTDFEETGGKVKSYNGSMINDGTYIYTWSSANAQGMKLKITADMEKQIETDKQTSYVDPNVKGSYTCSTWTGDEGKFTPPSGMTFMDYSAQIEQMRKLQPSAAAGEPGTENTDMRATQCASCETLPGDQKTACKTALRCP